MAAPKGNQFWRMRSKDGREYKYTDPQVFLEECYNYFQWCDENPWYKNDVIRSGENAGQPLQIPTQRPYTKVGLCVYLGISEDTFDNYKQREDFLGVLTHVEFVIRQNQLEGASVGAFNSSIIARVLGLADKQDINHKGHLVINTSKKSKKKIEDIGDD